MFPNLLDCEALDNKNDVSASNFDSFYYYKKVLEFNFFEEYLANH